MKGYFEKHRDEDTSILAHRRCYHLYPAHFHSNMEIYIVKKGGAKISINGNDYVLDDGCIAICDCFDMHSIDKQDFSSDDCILIIPYEHLSNFNYKRKDLRIKNNIIKNAHLAEQLLSLIDKFLINQPDESISICATNLILMLIYPHLSFSAQKNSGEFDLFRQILIYIQANFKSDISRKKIANHLGYVEAHVSRVFHKFLNKGISEYINSLRIDYINRQMASGNKKTKTELIFESGFQSQQTYYRVKKKYD